MDNEQRELPKACGMCGAGVILRRGPFSSFLGCANYPRCSHKYRLTEAEAERLRGQEDTAKRTATTLPDRVAVLERRVAELEAIIRRMGGERSATPAKKIAKAGQSGRRGKRRTPAEARTEAQLEKEFRQIVG